MGGRHRQEIPDSGGGKPRMEVLRQLVREGFGDPIVEGEPALVDHHPYRQRDEALAYRIHPVLVLRRPWRPVSLRRDPVVTHQQKTVHADAFGVDSLQEIQDRLRRDALAFR